MTRYHVNDKGKKGICQVTVSECKFVSFENSQDADAYAAKVLEVSYPTFNSVKKDTSRSLSNPRKSSNLPLADLNLGMRAIENSNSLPKVQPLPSGLNYSDFEKLLADIASDNLAHA